MSRPRRDTAAEPAIELTAPRSELAAAVRRVAEREPQPPGAAAVLHLGMQRPNTLLHDGWAWRRYPPSRLLEETEAALATAASRGAVLVHASYAWLHAVDAGADPGPHLLPVAEAALEAERLVLGSGHPAWVVRLGYLYGPESRDLRAYRTAFRLGRPYWAGPGDRLQHHLHSDDAARALLLAVRSRPRRRPVYATDSEPASFAAFMDHYARHVAHNPLPLHIPALARPLTRFFIADEHVEQCRLGMPGPPEPQLPGFVPVYPDHRTGIDTGLRAG